MRLGDKRNLLNTRKRGNFLPWQLKIGFSTSAKLSDSFPSRQTVRVRLGLACAVAPAANRMPTDSCPQVPRSSPGRGAIQFKGLRRCGATPFSHPDARRTISPRVCGSRGRGRVGEPDSGGATSRGGFSLQGSLPKNSRSVRSDFLSAHQAPRLRGRKPAKEVESHRGVRDPSPGTESGTPVNAPAAAGQLGACFRTHSGLSLPCDSRTAADQDPQPTIKPGPGSQLVPCGGAHRAMQLVRHGYTEVLRKRSQSSI